MSMLLTISVGVQEADDRTYVLQAAIRVLTSYLSLHVCCQQIISLLPFLNARTKRAVLP